MERERPGCVSCLLALAQGFGRCGSACSREEGWEILSTMPRLCIHFSVMCDDVHLDGAEFRDGARTTGSLLRCKRGQAIRPAGRGSGVLVREGWDIALHDASRGTDALRAHCG